MFTFEGKDVSADAGAPSLRDLGVHLSREGRYVGAAQRFWPVSLHSLAVTDLLPRRLEHHGLLHDAAEALTGDIPKPFKIPEMKALEVRLLRRIYESLRVDFPTPDEEKQIKEADRRILVAEVHLFGPPKAWGVYVPAVVDEEAERALQRYLNVPSEDYLEPDGGVVKLFYWRLRDAIKRARERARTHRYKVSEKGRACQWRHSRSEKRRATMRRYLDSEKGRATTLSYNRSENRRASEARRQFSEKRRISSSRYQKTPGARMLRKLYDDLPTSIILRRLRDQERRRT